MRAVCVPAEERSRFCMRAVCVPAKGRSRFCMRAVCAESTAPCFGMFAEAEGNAPPFFMLPFALQGGITGGRRKYI